MIPSLKVCRFVSRQATDPDRLRAENNKIKKSADVEGLISFLLRLKAERAYVSEGKARPSLSRHCCNTEEEREHCCFTLQDPTVLSPTPIWDSYHPQGAWVLQATKAQRSQRETLDRRIDKGNGRSHPWTNNASSPSSTCTPMTYPNEQQWRGLELKDMGSRLKTT